MRVREREVGDERRRVCEKQELKVTRTLAYRISPYPIVAVPHELLQVRVSGQGDDARGLGRRRKRGGSGGGTRRGSQKGYAGCACQIGVLLLIFVKDTQQLLRNQPITCDSAMEGGGGG